LMIGMGAVAISATLLLIWYYVSSWKPGQNDLVILKSFREVTLVLVRYDEGEVLPYWWLWRIEFRLENRYRKDLEIQMKIQFNQSTDWSTGYWSSLENVVVPGKGRANAALSGSMSTASRHSLPQGTYRILARTELLRKSGSEVKTHTFEWQLLTGFINQTTYPPRIPDRVPGED